MKKRYLFIPIALFIVIAGIFMLQLLRNAQGERPTDLESRLIGKPLPDFKLIGLEPGKVYERSDLINGEPFLLTVWATWCPSCYEEHHFLNTLARQGTRIIGIDSKKGSIEPGKKADLVLVDDKMNVHSVWLDGKLI